MGGAAPAITLACKGEASEEALEGSCERRWRWRRLREEKARLQIRQVKLVGLEGREDNEEKRSEGGGSSSERSLHAMMGGGTGK